MDKQYNFACQSILSLSESCDIQVTSGKPDSKPLKPVPELDQDVPNKIKFCVQAKQTVIVHLYEDDPAVRYEISKILIIFFVS